MNPLSRLRPEWDLFKKRHRFAREKLHRSYTYKSRAISSMLYGEAVQADREARAMWQATVQQALGDDARIEWQGDITKPMCVVNGSMLFA